MPTGYKFDWHLPPSPQFSSGRFDLPLSSPPQKAQYFTLLGVYPYLSLNCYSAKKKKKKKKSGSSPFPFEMESTYFTDKINLK